MKSTFISDNRDTYLGMRMTGMDGHYTETPEGVEKALKEEMQNPDIGIIFMTEKAADMIPKQLLELRKKQMFPLITIIPDRHGYQHHNEITNYINEAVGL